MKFKEEWLDLSDREFEQTIAQWFGKMKGIGYRSATRIEHVQTAVDHVWGYAQFKDGVTAGHNPKWNAIGRQHKAIFGGPAPTPSPTIAEKAAKVGIAVSKETLLAEKLACLKNWKDTMYTDPDAFLQGAEDDVQGTLNDLLDDARKKATVSIKQPWMETWYGLDTSREVKWNRERLLRAVTGEVAFRAGASAEGEFKLEWKSVKLKVTSKNFAGARGHLSGKASVGVEQTESVIHSAIQGDLSKAATWNASVEGEAYLEIGVRMSVEAEVGIGDVFSAAGKAEAFAGAFAHAQAKLAIGAEGLAINASARAFAGVELNTSGSVTLSWKGRPIWTQKAEAALTFGAGAEASFTLEIPRVGATKLELSAGLTLGLGTKVGTAVEFSVTNLRLASEQWLYEEVRQFLVPRERRYELMMGDQANLRLCEQCMAEVQALLTAVRAEKDRLKAVRFR